MDGEDAKALLASEKERLTGLRAEYASLHEESENESLHELSATAQHPADLGSETFDREKDFSILEEVEGELADIEHALQRIDDGTYGTCEACGAPIADERLEAMPATRFCVDDQAKAEREHRAAASAHDD